MIEIKQFCFGPFMENSFLAYDETREGIIVDPGCYEEDERVEVKDFVSQNGLTLKYVINTHCHIDHVLGNEFIKNEFKIPLIIPKEEESMLKAVKTYASNYGFPLYQEAEIDQFVEEGEEIKFGNSVLQVLKVPGHSPGHIILFNKDQNICLGGDVLFRGSIGRTDLPGGNHDDLIENIKTKVFQLGDEMVIYSGHGPETTIGHEKKYNPFVGVN